MLKARGLLRRLLCFAAVALMLLMVTGGAFAQNAAMPEGAAIGKDPKKDFTQEELDARHKLIDSIMIDRHTGKISEAEALRQLASINVYPDKNEK